MRGIGRRLKRLREARGLTQEALAEKVGTSRVTIARIETRNRRPSLPMLQRLARALDVEVKEMLAETIKEASEMPIPGKEEVTVVDVKLRKLFPPDDPVSIPLLRLMAAANDARHVQKLMIAAMDDVPSNRGESLIQNGERGYLYRMLCGHLYEAGIAFRDLDTKGAARLDQWLAGEPEGLAALAHLRAVYLDASEEGFYKRVLNRIRTHGAFHYKDERFGEALTAHDAVAPIVVAQSVGMSRYSITDNFAVLLVAGAVGATEEGFKNGLADALGVSTALGGMLDFVLLARLQENADAIEKTKTVPIRIPAAVHRVRQREEQRRGEGNRGEED